MLLLPIKQRRCVLLATACHLLATPTASRLPSLPRSPQDQAALTDKSRTLAREHKCWVAPLGGTELILAPHPDGRHLRVRGYRVLLERSWPCVSMPAWLGQVAAAREPSALTAPLLLHIAGAGVGG